MGWFDEQIKQRIQDDELDFSRVAAELSGVVMGKKALRFENLDDRVKTQDALDEILRYYHETPRELPNDITDVNDQLEYLLRPTGIARRVVNLTRGWYKDAQGAMLGRTKNGEPVALIPTIRGYRFYHYESGEYIRVSAKTEALLASEAICFYRPLPMRKINAKDLFTFMLGSISTMDVVMVAASALAVTLLGMFMPHINRLIFSGVAPSGRIGLLLPVAALMVGIAVSTTIVNIIKSLVMTGLNVKMQGQMQAAAMMRVLSLPADFFRKFNAGDLATRTQSFSSLCAMLSNTLFTTGLSFLFSFAYLAQIGNYAASLVIPALLVLVATLAVSVATTLVQVKISKKRMQSNAKQNGLVFALFSGIPKIKLAGAERRAFTQWAQSYKEFATLSYDPPAILKFNAAITSAVSLIGVIVIYYFAAKSGISTADYMAFNIAYGMLSASFAGLGALALTLSNFKPTLQMIEPILEAEPEAASGKKPVERISGGLEVSNVCFRYGADTPQILDNFSLSIRPGQYIAIVGKTGCGKSTLMRIMLGFEKPQKGTVYYDGRDIAELDLRALRRNIGVVMQNGKLFQGDIFSNITISAPWLTLDEAWLAAEKAGVAEDIRRMPMGMHTIISEGSGGISGGQRQRLMIARAIAPGPKLLMFDEATSALDNITQKTVSESLASLKCTRIVIAHRLSTVRQCDRILVMDNGKIIEDGSYEKLIEANGAFSALVARQRLDLPEDERPA